MVSSFTVNLSVFATLRSWNRELATTNPGYMALPWQINRLRLG